MEKLHIGYALTGSFCTFERSLEQMKRLRSLGHDLLPVMSYNAYSTDTRFGAAKEFVDRIKEISNNKVIHTIVGAEPIGPRELCDILVVAPCTGNTLSKIALGITDTPVTMAVKSQLRIERPVLLCVASNDALGASAPNIGRLMNTKNIYFVPLSQDSPEKKPNSLVADFSLIPACINAAMNRAQLQPVYLNP